MRSEEEEKILADLYLDLKGRKNKRHNWIEIAAKCQQLADHYNSVKIAARKLGVSYQLVRSIITLLQLPKEVQQLVKDNRIRYDAAQRLRTVKDQRSLVEVANAIRDLPSHKQREIIQFRKQHPNASLTGYIKRATKPKPEPEKIHIAVLPLRKETYQALHTAGNRQKISVEKMILNIIDKWIEKGERTS